MEENEQLFLKTRFSMLIKLALSKLSLTELLKSRTLLLVFTTI